MNVRICGPNLSDQRKGQFHVHHASCNDLNYYGPGRRYGGYMLGTRETLVEHATFEKCVLAVYDNGILDERREDGNTRQQEVESLMHDFWFAPCCAEFLQHSEVANWEDEAKAVTPVYEVWVVGDKDSFVKLTQDELQQQILGIVNRLTVGQHLSIGVHSADEYH